MSLGSAVAAGLGLCLVLSLAAGGGAWWVWRGAAAKSAKPAIARVDPDREARDADRREQQLLLAALSKGLAPREGEVGRWSPRGVSPVSGRAVLLFDSWRPIDENGRRSSRRRGPEALLVGRCWPFILSVDLRGLTGPEAARVAEEVIANVRATPGTRVRLVTGADPGIRERVERIVQADGCNWSAYRPSGVAAGAAGAAADDALDLATDGTLV